MPPSTKERQQEIRLARQRKRESLIGETLIKVIKRGEFVQSSQEAYRESQITLGALSIYPIIFTFESELPYLFRFSLSGAIPQEFGLVIGRNIKSGQISTLSSLPYPVLSLSLKPEYIEKFKRYGWEDVSKYLRERSENNEIDRALETCLFWIGEAANEQTLASALIKYFTAIETLIVGPHQIKSMVSTVASRLAVLVGRTPEQGTKIREEVEKGGGLYALRSEVVHQGRTEIEETGLVFRTGALAAWAFLVFLKARGFASLDEAIEKLDQVSSKVFDTK